MLHAGRLCCCFALIFIYAFTKYCVGFRSRLGPLSSNRHVHVSYGLNNGKHRRDPHVCYQVCTRVAPIGFLHKFVIRWNIVYQVSFPVVRQGDPSRELRRLRWVIRQQLFVVTVLRNFKGARAAVTTVLYCLWASWSREISLCNMLYSKHLSWCQAEAG